MNQIESLGSHRLAAAPIDEQGFVSIGGIDQWIAIQGSNIQNPVILFLHGGPGEAQSPFLKDFEPWLKDFTVVNWDQRGAGKTHEKNGASMPSFTLDRLVEDAVLVSEYARKKLGKKKLILVGQSAGSMIGLLVASAGSVLRLCRNRPIGECRSDGQVAGTDDPCQAHPRCG